MATAINIFWFRRDLRLDDNLGFYNALRGKNPVLPIFIFDTEILESLPKDDARVTFIHDILTDMNAQLKEQGSGLAIYYGTPLEVFAQLSERFDIGHVITNHDYEPYAEERDQRIANYLKEKGIGFHTYQDQVIFEKDQIVKDNGDPYVVYTPYMKKWKYQFRNHYTLKHYEPAPLFDNLWTPSDLPFLSLEEIGFRRSSISVPPAITSPSLIQQYEARRNFPAVDGTSRLGPHLRFGTVSVRKMVAKAIAEKNEIFWQELIWREFFMQILWHFPHTVHKAFKPAYDRIAWNNDPEDFEKWKKGETGYSLVDAGMRELNSTGYMHNRVRMLVASFLCKHLLIDWRWGEAYFAEKLLDYEMASNVGNWQWAAGSGVDAAPYFRIFNPMTQAEKFDKEQKYIRKWVKEFGTNDYPTPMVDHKWARERCLSTYKEALN
ncbi:deoxyribodipyrimidine photo-lyase [Aureisphaera galaxeae]|uniref:cryptochrome/photolyase family protein n=1 Tax=Aureisphaera galaxeae TaxID=1538023 RepID=UPI0023509D6B|nr:deoxyribodipyrimidine photo-lyase [Aureisphaera galaxeae]MDC8003800.1 deoxyribodipyrimidine photo-lyase [Aureisphaera galaxeae]